MNVTGKFVPSERNGFEILVSDMEVLGECPADYPLAVTACDYGRVNVFIAVRVEIFMNCERKLVSDSKNRFEKPRSGTKLRNGSQIFEGMEFFL